VVFFHTLHDRALDKMKNEVKVQRHNSRGEIIEPHNTEKQKEKHCCNSNNTNGLRQFCICNLESCLGKIYENPKAYNFGV
jgi:hypothetical protein